MMEDVVIEGTGQEAKLPGYKVAGKTGTAAEARPERRLLDERSTSPRSSASFRRRTRAVVILVTVDEPSVAIWGGVVALRVPADRRFDLQYLEIPPDDPSSLPPQ